MPHLEQLRSSIAPLRQALFAHPIYQQIRDPAALRVFMQSHVFAVWDFMSLLKALQARLCGTSVPWLPGQCSAGSRLINEIVLAEETDIDGRGGYASHFELYRSAMRDFGADSTPIDRFLAALGHGQSLDSAMQTAEVAEPVRRFVRHTFASIRGGDVCALAAAFTFGREDLLPQVFQRIVAELSADGRLDGFKFYLLRHVELDGDEHGPMATKLVSTLCANDPLKWQAATSAAAAALTARLAFWDAIHAALQCAPA
ncbi:MAG TPA: DUF3050 domain-containing protein, partial [Pirellulales bacterium]|nr:DUF3050 domain-containing protein [Pirellulales bacterium]